MCEREMECESECVRETVQVSVWKRESVCKAVG